MNQIANNRKQVICSLLPEQSEKLMDVGCGPILPSYPYAEKAKQVTCLDWKLITLITGEPHIGGTFLIP